MCRVKLILPVDHYGTHCARIAVRSKSMFPCFVSTIMVRSGFSCSLESCAVTI